jgi:putative MFS transporter
MASAQNPLRAIDAHSTLSRNQWLLVAACATGGMLEFLDGYIIAFVLAFIIGPWQLSYGQTAMVLLSSGLGALAGSFVWGYLADRIGRKLTFVATICTCALGSLALAFTPEGDWVYLTLLRGVVGFGVGGFFVPMMLLQEFLPASRRGRAGGIVSAATAGGLVLGALMGAFLAPLIGWRGLFAVGALPIVFGLALLAFLPESPRWALAKGRLDLARRSLLWALPPGAEVREADLAALPPVKPATWGEVFKMPRSLIVGVLVNVGVVTAFYGMVMWAPTLLSQVQSIPGAQAAKTMIGISIAGLISRFVMGYLSDRFGRKPCGATAAFGAATFLILAGLVGHGDLLEPGLFWLPLALAFVFADSSFAVLGVYTSEIWPSRLRGRGSGACYAASGIGKIVGPLGFALVIGSSNVIRPTATVDAILLAFGYLAAMFVVAGLAYVFVGRETRGVSMDTLDSVRDEAPVGANAARPAVAAE